MAAGDSHANLRESISAGIRNIREALDRIHEDAVAAVKRLDQLEQEHAKHLREIADLESKARLAESLNEPGMAREIRDHIGRRRSDIDGLVKAVESARAAAEAAKGALPAQQELFLQEISRLRTRLRGAPDSNSTSNSDLGVPDSVAAKPTSANESVLSDQETATIGEMLDRFDAKISMRPGR